MSRKRLRTVLLARQGFTAPEIATCTGFSCRMVQIWVERCNAEGLEGLETKSGRGRKPPLTPDQAEQLIQRLDAGPLPDDVCVRVRCNCPASDVPRSGHDPHRLPSAVRGNAQLNCGVGIRSPDQA